MEIDVANWRLDDLYFNYPEGARSKNAYFPPFNLELDFIIPTRRYLYKRSARKYPDQFWGEVVAYQVGCELGVTVPPAFAAYDSSTGTCGALIEWFYEDGQAELRSGGNYMQQIDPEYDRKRGNQHNFRYISVIGTALAKHIDADEDWLQYWSKALLFDSLIGNTDRHQDNWGYLFLGIVDGKNKANLSPLFDNGTSLGHERFPELIKDWRDVDYERYINKGTHHMRWMKDDEKRVGHIEMIRILTHSYPEFKPLLSNMIRDFSLEKIASKLEYLQNLKLNIPLTNDRTGLYLKLISLRKQKIELLLS